MSSDEQGAIWYPTTNCWHSRYGYEAKYIILHGTASNGDCSAQDIAAYFKSTENSDNPVSAHYIIDKSGIIYQTVSERDAAWGNGIRKGNYDSWWKMNPNLTTISIEHVNSKIDNSVPLTPAQKQASFQLIKHICQRWKIPMRKADQFGGITGHYSIDPIDRARCPGNYPEDELFNFLGGSALIDVSNPVIAQHFVLIGTNRWQCKDNGFIIANGMLDHYKNASNDKFAGLTELGLPLNNEHSIVGQDGKVLNGIVEQEFERGILRWDANHVVENPPGSSSCYTINLSSLYDNAQKASVLTNQSKTFQAAISELQKQMESLQKQRDAAVLEAQSLTQKNQATALQVQQLQDQIKNIPTSPKITSEEVLKYLASNLTTNS